MADAADGNGAAEQKNLVDKAAAAGAAVGAVAAAAGGDKSGSGSTYYPADAGKPNAPLFQKMGAHHYLHGDFKTCKLCASCFDPCMKCCNLCKMCYTCGCIPGCNVSCGACITCQCHPKCVECCECKCIPCCATCKTCGCIPNCDMSCPACQTCNCHPSCPDCPDCDLSCEACMKCGCHPSCGVCAKCLDCDCGPEVELKAVGCELCPGPFAALLGNWHLSTSRFPKPLPAIIFPCCCGARCPCIPCPGGKDETFVAGSEDFKNPGQDGGTTGTIKWLQMCCPNPVAMINANIAQFEAIPGFKSVVGEYKKAATDGDGEASASAGVNYKAGAAVAGGAAAGGAAAGGAAGGDAVVPGDGAPAVDNME